jgi:hypothetical protein
VSDWHIQIEAFIVPLRKALLPAGGMQFPMQLPLLVPKSVCCYFLFGFEGLLAVMPA